MTGPPSQLGSKYGKEYNPMKILQLLNEIHYQDFYSRAFQDFVNKYKKFKDDTTIYVNFNNHYGNTEDKSMFANPNHGDPMGIYAYPLKYVIDHPMDVRYGKTSKFLRVLKRTDKGNTLWVQHENDSTLNQIFFHETKIHFGEVLNYLKIIYGKGVAPRVLWFKALQNTDESLNALLAWAKKSKRQRSDERPPEVKLKTATEQNAMWKRHGYDAIIDTAKNQKNAVVNGWEPEQAIFLSRGAFKVIETIEMGRSRKDTSGFITNTSTEYTDALLKSITAAVAKGIGDKIISKKALTSGMGGYFMYFTEAGRMIGCYMHNNNDDFLTLKLGEKKHKKYKKYDDHEIHVKIVSEKKTIEMGFAKDERTSNIAPDVIAAWHAETGANEAFVPLKSAADYEKFRQEQQKQQMYKEFADRFDRDYPESTVDEILKTLSENFGIDTKIAESYEDKFVALVMANSFIVRLTTYINFKDEKEKVDEDFYTSFLTEPPEITKLIEKTPLAVKQALVIQKVAKENIELIERNVQFIRGKMNSDKLQSIRRFGIVKTIESEKSDSASYQSTKPPPVIPSTPKSLTVRYRNKETGEVWSGRGLRPKWVQAALDSGKTLDDLKM